MPVFDYVAYSVDGRHNTVKDTISAADRDEAEKRSGPSMPGQ